MTDLNILAGQEVPQDTVNDTSTDFYKIAIKQLRLNKPKSENLLLVPEKKLLPEITLSEVAFHDSIDDCWVVIYDRVYNVTDFLRMVNIYF